MKEDFMTAQNKDNLPSENKQTKTEEKKKRLTPQRIGLTAVLALAVTVLTTSLIEQIQAQSSGTTSTNSYTPQNGGENGRVIELQQAAPFSHDVPERRIEAWN